ncbi:MAG: Ca-activated chloride channel family protein [Verrucomicrobiales bacterium]|jgi:Ca-activated chloride channel family protein
MPDFAHPWVFLLLLPLLVGLLLRWVSAPPSIGVPSTAHYRPDARRRRLFAPRHFLLLLEGLAGLLIITALARPQLSIEVVPVTRDGTDLMIVLDFSNSMDLFDPQPGRSESRNLRDIEQGFLVDRLTVARTQIARFVKRRPDDRIGLAIFGMHSFTACPPTLDHDFVLAQVAQLTNSLLSRNERGTNIASGLAAGINELVDHGERRRTIILITDGENTVNDPVFTPLEAASLAAEKDITIHAVAIGSDSPYAPPDIRWMLQNRSFNTKAIEALASTANGRFFRPTDIGGFEAVMDTIDALETTTRTHPAVIYQRDLFPFLTIAAAISLLGAFVLRRTLLLEIS